MLIFKILTYLFFKERKEQKINYYLLLEIPFCILNIKFHNNFAVFVKCL